MMRKIPFIRRRPVIEEVEPRILYSADFSPALLDGAPVMPVSEHRTIDASGEFIGIEAVDQHLQRHEVAFVDTATPDYQKLIEDIRGQAGPERRLDVILLDSNTDGVEQISSVLAGLKDVSAVHLIGHGSDGEVRLGATTLNFDSLVENATQIKGWGQALSVDADLLIYGCDVAQAAPGRALVDALARLTGADVAASDDPTGSSAKGGDWDLEYRIGTIESALAVSEAQQITWDGLLDAAPAAVPAAVATPATEPTVASVPLAFEQNQGQADAQLDFIARGGGYAVGLTGGDAILLLDDGAEDGGHVVRLNVVGANPAAAVAGENLLEGKTNYLVGDQEQWLTDVANYGGVRYDGVYDGVDLRYYGNQRQLEYDFMVGAGANVDAIRLRFDGVQNLAIAATGDLVLTLDDAGHTISFKAPVAYQEGADGREAVTSRYVLAEDGTVGFEVGAYDSSRQLVIDPVLSYGSYFGTSGTDVANGIAVDAAGNVYVTGYVPAAGGLLGGLLGVGAGDQVFVTKFSPTLSSALYTTIVGGSKDDYGTSIAVDTAGNAYVTGYTSSTDFPTVSAYQSARSGNQDAFVFKLNAAGSALTYSTYLGGTGNVEQAWAIAVDGAGSAYVAGVAANANFPTTVGAADTSFTGASEAFVVKLSAAGNTLVYSTFVGGNGAETGFGIAVDAAGNAVVVGNTSSSDLATVNPYRSTNAGTTDAFVARLNSTGTAFTYLSYLGGSGIDIAYNVALDAGGKIYVTGETSSANFSLSSNPLKTTRSGATDAFVSVIDPSQSLANTLVYSTYLGGSNSVEAGLGIGVDAGGRVYVSGQTDSNNFQVTAGAYKTTTNTNGDAFLVILAPLNTGAADLVYGTYFGGTNADYGDIGVYSNGKYYLAGDTASSSGIATAGSYDTSQNGGTDAFVAVFTIAPTVTTTSGSLAYNESSGARAFDATLVVSDPGIASLGGAVVQITGSYVNGEDILGFVNQLGITGTWDAATGTLTLAGTSSVVNYQSALRAVTYQNTSEKPSTTARTVTVTVTDGVLASAAATRSIAVTSLNDPPVNTVPGTQTTSEETSLVFSAANGNAILVSDVDADSLLITVSVTNGTLTFGGSTSTTFSVTGTLATLNAALDGLTYSPTANFNGTAVLQIVANDLGATGSDGQKTDTDSIGIAVTAVNDAPVLSGANNLATIGEDPVANPGTLVSSLIAGKLSDVDFGAVGGIAVTAVDNTNGTWQYSTNGGATWSSFAALSASNAQLLAADSSSYVRFAPNANWTGTVAGGITLRGWDQSSGVAGGTADTSVNGGVSAFSSATAAAAIVVSSVNDAPVNTVPAAQTTNEDTPLLFSAFNGNQISIGDVDAGAGSVQVSLSVGSGQLSLAQTTGLTFVTGSGSGSSAMTFTGALPDINAALNGLRFDPAANYSGAVTLTLTTNDQGNTGAGGALTATSTVGINVVPVNDAPSNSVPGPQSTLQDLALVFSGASGNALTVADIDAGAGLLQVTLGSANGTLTLGATSGLASFTGDGTATIVLIGTQTDINTALDGLRFDPTAGYSGAAGITIVTDDQGNTGAGGSLAATTTVAITVSSDLPPSVTTTVAPLAYTENDAAIPVDLGLTVSDPDSALLDHAVVRVSAGYVKGKDLLEFANQPLIVGTWDADSGTLTLGAATGASAADFEAALRSVTYRNLSDDPSGVTRTVSFAVNDGIADGPVAIRRIDITAVNDAPSNTVPVAQTVFEDGALTFSAADGNAIAIGDPDAGSDPVQVLLSVSDGVLTLAQTSGISFAAGADGSDSMTLVGTVDDINAALNGLRFNPDADFSGTAQLQIETDDQGNSGMGGAQILTSIVTVNVSSVNDAPSGDDNTVTALEDGSYVFAIADFRFDDAIDAPSNAILAVEIATLPGAGVLTDDGMVVTTGQVISAADIASGKLVFTPVADDNGAAYASFTFQVQDDGGVANGGIDLDPIAHTMTIDVTAVNDAPQGTDHTVGALEDTPYVFAAADFGFGDPVDNAVDNLLAVKIVGLPGVGTLTDNGTAVNAGDFVSFTDIAAGLLQFTAAADASGGAYTSFTFQVQDDGGTAAGGIDLDATARTMTIDVTALNDAPQGADNTVITLEDAPYVFANVDFGFSDPRDTPANAASAVVIASLPFSGTLMLNGTAVLAGDVVSQVDVAAGNLQFTPAADANGAGYASFTFQLQDDGGTSGGGVDLDPTARTLTIDVTAVNDSPTLVLNVATSVTSGASVLIGDTRLDVADPDNSPSQLVFTLTSVPAGGSLLLAGTPLLLNGTFTQADVSNALVTYRHAGVSTGTDAFNLSVSDGSGGTLGPVTFRIDIVTPPPPAPPTPPVVAPPAPPTPTPPAPGSGSSTPPAPTPPSTPSTPAPGSGGSSGGSTPGGGSGGGASAQPVEGGAAAEALLPGANSTPDAVAAALAGDARTRNSTATRVQLAAPLMAFPTASALTLGGSALGAGLVQNLGQPMVQTETLTISGSDPGFSRAPDAVRLEAYRSSLGNKEWVGALDQMRNDAGAEAKPEQKIVVGSTVAVTGAMSVGYVIWLLRGGLLLSSLLSSLPAWSVIDPMPILSRSGRSEDDAGGDDPLERLFGRAKAAVGLGRRPASPPAVPEASQMSEAPDAPAAAALRSQPAAASA